MRREFGFSKRLDYLSALLLNMRIEEDLEYRLVSLIEGKRVAVVGAGPSLVNVREFNEDVIIAADGATNYLVKLGIIPDIIVSDLDGISVFPDSLYVVHAHGDNILTHWKINYMKDLVGTVQVSPFGRLKLYGGFTDGDRALILAKNFGAKSIKMYAMDFDSELIGRYSKPYYLSDVPMNSFKRRKLMIAKEIVHDISRKDL